MDAIGEVTMADQAAIAAIKAEYQDLSVKNKTYVKKYKKIFTKKNCGNAVTVK